MQCEQMAAKQPSLNHPSSRSVRLAKVPSFLVATFVTLTTLAIFVPLNPDMPDKGIDQAWISAMRGTRGSLDQVTPIVKLDQSWVIAMNEAVARHLRFGKEIIFTFGPYASIYTRFFHPATDRQMVFGSLLIGLSYVIALLYLARDRKPYLLLILILFLATFPSGDALLLSYAFLLVVCALRFTNSDDFNKDANLSWWHILTIIAMFSASGPATSYKRKPSGTRKCIRGYTLPFASVPLSFEASRPLTIGSSFSHAHVLGYCRPVIV